MIRYPKAMLLRVVAVAHELAMLFTWVGFPNQIVTDQGSIIMGKILNALAQLVGLHALHTTMYHPQMNGLVESFNGILNRMLKKFIHGGG